MSAIHSFKLDFILITTILLSLTPFSDATRLRSDDGSEIAKQRRLFSQMNNNWPFPMSEMLADDQMMSDEAQPEPEPPNPEFLFIDDLTLKQRKSSPFQQFGVEPEPHYDIGQYDSERELESSLPYGIQNVLEGGSARLPRSKNRMSRITFQSLCPSKRETVLLNLESDYEYRPDHYEEVTCAHPLTSHHDFKSHNNKMMLPVCSEAGFSCIQLNRTLFLTRRIRGATCWESETRLVAAGCECMWPKHHLGDITAHH